MRQMAGAAAGKKESVSLSLFVEVSDLEVEGELSTMATLAWAEGSGWEEGEKSSRRLGRSRSSMCRHGDK